MDAASYAPAAAAAGRYNSAKQTTRLVRHTCWKVTRQCNAVVCLQPVKCCSMCCIRRQPVKKPMRNAAAQCCRRDGLLASYTSVEMLLSVAFAIDCMTLVLTVCSALQHEDQWLCHLPPSARGGQGHAAAVRHMQQGLDAAERWPVTDLR